MLGIKTTRTLITYIEKDWLEGCKFPNGYWMVTRASLDAFASVRGQHAVQKYADLLD